MSWEQADALVRDLGFDRPTRMQYVSRRGGQDAPARSVTAAGGRDQENGSGVCCAKGASDQVVPLGAYSLSGEAQRENGRARVLTGLTADDSRGPPGWKR